MADSRESHVREVVESLDQERLEADKLAVENALRRMMEPLYQRRGESSAVAVAEYRVAMGEPGLVLIAVMVAPGATGSTVTKSVTVAAGAVCAHVIKEFPPDIPPGTIPS